MLFTSVSYFCASLTETHASKVSIWHAQLYSHISHISSMLGLGGDDENFILLMLLIVYYNSCRESNYLTRSALVRPYVSPWNKLLNYGDNTSFLTLTGMTRRAFFKLEGILFPAEVVGRKRGRPQSLRSSWYVPFLRRLHHEDEALVHDFWCCSIICQRNYWCHEEINML